MKFRFPFQNVLKHRKILEDIAQKDFQLVVFELNKQKQILSDFQEQIFIAREEAYRLQTKGGTASPALSQIHEFIKGQDIRIERQQAKIQECENKVEELREILRQKAVEYKIIERLRDKKKQEFAVEQRKLEQKQTDDLNTMRFRTEEKK